jgi:integrase
MACAWQPEGRNVYAIQFKGLDYKQHCKSSGMKDYKCAYALAVKIEEDAERIRAGKQPLHPETTGRFLGLAPTSGQCRWPAFRARFEKEHLAGLRDKTRVKYRTVFNVLEEEINPQTLTDLGAEGLSRFVAQLHQRHPVKRGKKTAQQGFAPWTVRNYLVAIKKALAWAVDQDLLAVLPRFPAVKVPKKRPQPIDPADWQKLYRAVPDDLWRAYLLCGWLAGLRLQEALQLRRRPAAKFPWVNWALNRIVLPAGFVKADEDQSVPLHPDLRRALEQLPDTGDRLFPFVNRQTGRDLTPNGVCNNVIGWARMAGVALSMHRLRKGFGCQVASLLGKGSAPVLHQLMRHSSMQVTMDFYANVDGVLQEAIQQIPGAPDPGPPNPDLTPPSSPAAGQDPQSP